MDVSEAWGMATKRGQKTQGDWVKTHDLPHGGTQGPKVLIIAMFACRSLLIHTHNVGHIQRLMDLRITLDHSHSAIPFLVVSHRV